MALQNSPKIVTKNLIFYFDMNNKMKSWLGKPITNYYGDFSTSSGLRPNTQHLSYGAGWVGVDPGAPSPGFNIGKVYKFVSGSLTSTWSGNSYGYMFKDLASANGSVYTFSFWAYVSADCNIDYLPATSETTSGYGTPNIQNAYDLTKKGTWQKIGISSTGVGTTTRWLAYPARYGVTDGSFTGYFLIGGVQVEDGSFDTPYSESTRTNTQSIIDLTKNNTLTANSLTYNTDGTFSFNGSSNYITAAASSNFGFGSNGTVEQLVYISGNSGTNNRLWCVANNSSGLDAYLNGGSYNVYMHGGIVGTTTALPVSQSVLITVTYSAGAVTIYFNGIAQPLTGTTTGYNITNAGALFIGEYSGGGNYYYNGKIYLMRVYDRALTADEVKQNFNATRSRYGI